MNQPDHPPARWLAITALTIAAAIIASFLIPLDTSQATGPIPPDPGRAAKAYPDPSGSGVDGDLATATVILVGDSIANGCRVEIRAALAAGGVTSAIDYWSGRPTEQGVSRALSLSRKPPVFVMELGTNDWANPPAMKTQIARLIAGVPSDTKVLWVDTYNGNNLLASGWVNQEIYGSGVQVIAWWRWFAQKPTRDALYLRDRVHPKVAPGPGCAFLADVIKAQIIAAANG